MNKWLKWRHVSSVLLFLSHLLFSNVCSFQEKCVCFVYCLEAFSHLKFKYPVFKKTWSILTVWHPVIHVLYIISRHLHGLIHIMILCRMSQKNTHNPTADVMYNFLWSLLVLTNDWRFSSWQQQRRHWCLCWPNTMLMKMTSAIEDSQNTVKTLLWCSQPGYRDTFSFISHCGGRFTKVQCAARKLASCPYGEDIEKNTWSI